MQIKLIRIVGLLSILWINSGFADTLLIEEGAILKQRIGTSDKLMCSDKLRCGSNLTPAFYQQNLFAPIWSNKSGDLTDTAWNFINAVHHAYEEGLDPRSYHVRQIDKLVSQLDNEDDSPKRTRDLATMDMLLTDAFFLYANNLYYGLLDAKKVYPFWENVKKPINLINVLNKAINDGDPQAVLTSLEPTYPGYAKLKEKLSEYQDVAQHNGWDPIPPGETLELDSSGERVKMLQRRLQISGELGDDYDEGSFDKQLQSAVMQFQANNGLYDDGIVESETLHALNISVKTRIRLIELNMDKMRLLPQDLGDEYIIVNLPEYSLNLYRDGKPALTMDVAVGGAEHASCVLNSKIAYLVLNPYWNIPAQIAESEIWPILKTDPDYLMRKHVQVLQKLGNDWKEIDGTKINWSKLTSRQFNSYRYRQAPGELNALGKVKFIFPNQCGIYLHDSNESEVFDIYRRDFSHGCIRVGEPFKLTDYVLNADKGWSQDKVTSEWDKTGDSRTINLTKPVRLYIVYFTAWVSADDWVQFRSDIYNFDKLSPYSVYLPPVHNNKKSEASKVE